MEIIAILMLTGPAAAYLLTLPLSARLGPRLRMAYRILGALVVFAGSSVTFYFAMYAGEQGGITAYFFQLGVITAYLALSALVAGLHMLLKAGKGF